LYKNFHIRKPIEKTYRESNRNKIVLIIKKSGEKRRQKSVNRVGNIR
jgi:hypothetical protein